MTMIKHVQECIDWTTTKVHTSIIVMSRLHGPMGYKLLGMDRPPLVVHHSTVSDYVKSMRIVG